MTRQDFKPWIIEAIVGNGGKAQIFQVSKFIWDNYHHKISRDTKVLYTWQYEIRWAAQSLRDDELIELGKFKKGVWSIKQN